MLVSLLLQPFVIADIIRSGRRKIERGRGEVEF